jgi:hypothetical protein
MREVARTTGERGVSTLELTMAMPLVVFAMLLLIGLGHALITKQHAVVGGQFAAHHQRVREAAPNAAAIGRAVSGGAETFHLSGGGDETLSYTTSATPRKGLIAQTYPLKAAASQYQTPKVTNACVPDCKPFDSFARILSPELITGIIFSGNSSALSTDDLLSIVAGKGKKKRRQKPEGAVAVSPGKTGSGNGDPGTGGRPAVSGTPAADGPTPASGGGGVTPPGKPPKGTAGGGAEDGKSGNGGNGGNGKPGNNGNGGPNLNKPQRLSAQGEPNAQRVRELGVNHEQGGVQDIAEGRGGARYEMATGRRISRSTEEGADFIDPEVGPISLKGPLVNKRTGQPIRITDQTVDGLAQAVVKDVQKNTFTKRVVVDTTGMTPDQRRRLEQQIESELAKNPGGRSKEIFIIE